MITAPKDYGRNLQNRSINTKCKYFCVNNTLLPFLFTSPPAVGISSLPSTPMKLWFNYIRNIRIPLISLKAKGQP